MPDVSNPMPVEAQDFDKLMKQAGEQYEVYVELNRLTSILSYGSPIESYQRDLSHPLSIHITA